MFACYESNRLAALQQCVQANEGASLVSERYNRLVRVPVIETYRYFVRGFLDSAPSGRRAARIEILRAWGVEERLRRWDLRPDEIFGFQACAE